MLRVIDYVMSRQPEIAAIFIAGWGPFSEDKVHKCEQPEIPVVITYRQAERLMQQAPRPGRGS